MPARENGSAGATSFFRVALVCEAAPHIGCGPIASPVLADVEQQPGVQEARLNRTGTILGVVWSSANAQPQKIIDALARHGLAGEELDSSERPLASVAFAAGDGWYRAMHLKALSAEEAQVIAARLVRRLQQKTKLPPDTVERLMRRLQERCALALEAGAAAVVGIELLREQVAEALLDAGRHVLDPAAYRHFEAVVALGHRPLSGER